MVKIIKLQFLLILITFLAINSCIKNNKKVLETSDTLNHPLEKISNKKNLQLKNKNTTDTKLELILELNPITINLNTSREYVPRISKLNADTAILKIEHTGQISDLQLTVFPHVPFDSILVEQKFENALTLNNMEGGFEHLKRWWYVDTTWQVIHNHKHKTFKITPSDYKEIEKSFNSLFKERFLEVKNEALKYKADNYYGTRIKQATTIDKLPLEYWASKYIIKITIKTGDTNIGKYLIIEASYGC